jgi:Flp pilus assembly protein TadD
MYACALLAKPTALPVVALLLLLDYWPLARLGRRTLLEKVPFLVLALLSGVVALVSQVHSGQGGTMEYVKSSYLPLTVAYGVGFYLLKVVWPAGLVSDYLYPTPLGLTNLEVLGSVIIAVGAGAAIALSVRRTRAWLAGGLFFFVAIFPTLGLIRFTSSIATNRSMYLPMVGILMPLQWELAGLWRRGIGTQRAGAYAVRAMVLGLGVALAMASAVVTRRYESHWSDTLTLLRYYLEEQPRDWRLHTRMGNEWIQRGDHRSALAEFKTAIGLNRTWTENHLNLGRAAFTLGDYSEAAQAFATALEQTPNDWRAHMLMGMTRERQGDLDGALQEFKTAARLAPLAAMPHFKIATILGQRGRAADAVREYQQTLRLEPRHAEARMALDALGARPP